MLNTYTNKFSKTILSIVIALSGFSFAADAQTTIISGSGDGGFETGTTLALNNWTVVNGAQTNQWALGTAAGGYTGARAAYISNNGGTSNAITNATSVVHFYRNVTFPAGQTQITLSFDYKQATLDQTFDYMKVFLVPTTTTPVAGTELSSGQIGNSEYPGGSALSSFTNFTITIPAANAGTTKRLVFSWHNDNANPKGAGAIDNIALTSCAPITVSASSNTPVCAGNNLNLTATSTASTFSWTGPNSFASSTQNPTIAAATASATGTYTVVASNGICSNSTTTTVTVNAVTSISSQPSNSTVCAGTNATFTLTAAGGGLTYQWQDNSSGSFANIAAATNASLTVSGTNVGMSGRQYKCNVSGTCGALTSNTVTLTVNAKPIGVATPTTQTLCEGVAITNIDLSESGGLLGTTYSWSRSNTGTLTGIANSGSSNPITGTLNSSSSSLATTTFTITPTSSLGCAGNTFTSVVNVNPSTVISTQPAVQTKCEGTNASYSVSAQGASLTYQWQDNSSGSFADIGGATSATLNVNGVTIGMSGRQYKCIVSGGCGTLTSNTASLTVNAVPVVNASSNPSNGVICGSGSVVLTATGASTYSWNPGGATTAAITISPLSTTSYTVTGTTTGCSATASQTVTVNPAVTSLASASVTTLCEGGNSVLAAVGGNSTNYTLSSIAYSAPLGSGSSATSGDDAVSGSIALPFTFSYYGANYNNVFAYTNGFVQFGTSSGSTTVYGQTLPSASNPNNIIAGVFSDLNAAANTITTFTTGSTPNRVFTIYYNNVQFYCSSCSGNKRGNTNFQIRLYEKSNIIEVHVHDVSNSSTTTTSKTLGLENSNGSAAKVPAGRNGSSGDWIVSTPEAWRFVPSGGTVIYSWSPATYLTDATDTNPTAQNMLASQNYVVTITDQNGCSAASSSIAITVNPLPNVTITPSGATAFCNGNNVTLTATAGLSSYSWSTSQTTQSIVVNSAANYTVTGTNSNNCSNVASQAITIYDTIPASIVVIGSTNLCTGQTTTDLQAVQGNAVGFVWSTTEPTSLITVNTGGTYSVTATDNHGCLHNQSQLMTESAAPAAPVISALSSTVLCSDGINTTNVSLHTTNYSNDLLWSTSETTQDISVDYGDLFNVTYTDVNGCYSVSNAIATVVKMYSTDPTAAVTDVSNNSLCLGAGTTLTVQGGSLGDDADWKWYEGSCSGTPVATGSSYSVNPSSTTTYFVRAEGPCNNTNCVQVTVVVKTLSVDATSASPSAPILCGSGNSNLSVSGGSLGTGATWVWYAGGCGNGASIGTGTTLVVTPSSTTTYFVRAEGDCNISNCAQANVTVKSFSVDPSTASNNATYNEICNGSPVSFNVTGGSLGSDANWIWYEGGCGSGSAVGNNSSISVTPSGGGIHTYFVRAEGYCNITNCVQVNVLVRTSIPSTVNTITAPSSACSGNLGVISVNNVNNATFYSWSGPSGVLFNGNPGPYQTASTNVSSTFGTLPFGTSGYSMCVFAGNACGQSNTLCSWVRAKVSEPGAISGSSVGCPNTSYTYNVPAVASADSYTWYITGNDASLNGTGLSSFTTSSPTVNVDFAAPFTGATLNVYASLNCGFNSVARSINIVRNPAIPGAITGLSYVCPNGSTGYSIPAGSTGVTYNWSCTVPGTVITPSGTSASMLFPATVPAGSLVCVSAVSGCGYASASRCKGIASGLPNTPSNITGPASGQCGATGVSFSIPPVSSATSYFWNVSNGNAAIVGPTNLSSISVDFTSNLNTVLLSVSAGNLCGIGGLRTYTVSGSPGTPTAINGNNSVCNGAVESYIASGSSGATNFNWQVPAGATILGGQGSANVLVLWGSNGGTLHVTASNTCGNSGTRNMAISVTCRQSQIQNTLQSEVKVFPNPAHDKMKVEITSTVTDRVQVQLINAIGEIVYISNTEIHEGTNVMELNLENVAKGFYQLSVQGNSINTQNRVVVE